MLTSIDLFSGPGGLCTGFKAAGIMPLIAVEWSYWTAQTYAATHNADILPLADYLDNPNEFKKYYFRPSKKPVLILGDITQVTNEMILELLQKRFSRDSVDIVTGGAPCESFSMAGQRKEEDYRNELFLNIPRIAKAVRAKLFMFENVKGLFSKKSGGQAGKMYEDVCDFFELDTGEGFRYVLASRDKKTVLLKASDFGVPQNRERVFLVGLNSDYPNLHFNYPVPTHGSGRMYPYVTVQDALFDLPFADRGEKVEKYTYVRNNKEYPSLAQYLDWVRGVKYTPKHLKDSDTSIITSHNAPNHLPRVVKRIEQIRVGENQKTAYERIFDEDPNSPLLECFPNILYGARNRRLNPHEPSFTVTSHCLDEMLHPSIDRALSPREVARLQSFPDWYIFKGPYIQFHGDVEQDRYEQIGDAIPPLLAYALAKSIVKAIKEATLNE